MTEPCERCGRLVVSGTTDFGLERMFILAPTCAGIDVRVDGVSLGFIQPDEMRDFLRRSYGEPRR